MGFRTLVMLYNDQSKEWVNDPSLGNRIMEASHHGNNFGCGQVVECVHTDTQTLAVINSYQFDVLARSGWNASGEDYRVELLRTAAREMGYTLVKDPNRR